MRGRGNPTWSGRRRHWSVGLAASLRTVPCFSAEVKSLHPLRRPYAVCCVQANGLLHTSPGQCPVFRGLKIRRSAESAVHGGDEAGRWPAIEPNCSPRALPWAGMKQAVGLDAADSIRPPQWVRWKMWVMTNAEALGYCQASLRDGATQGGAL